MLLRRRNLIVMLLATEIVMLACNLNFLFASAYLNDMTVSALQAAGGPACLYSCVCNAHAMAHGAGTAFVHKACLPCAAGCHNVHHYHHHCCM